MLVNEFYSIVTYLHDSLASIMEREYEQVYHNILNKSHTDLLKKNKNLILIKYERDTKYIN